MRIVLRILLVMTVLWLVTGCLDRAADSELSPSPVPTEAAEATATSPEALLALQATPQPTPTLAEVLATLAASSPTPTPTPSPSPTSTVTPSLSQRRELGELALHNEDFRAAADHFATLLDHPTELDDEEASAFRLRLGLSHLREGRFEAAIDAFEQYLEQSTAIDQRVHFYLGEAYQGSERCAPAVAAYQSYLEGAPATAPYIQPRIARCHLASGDRPAAITAYEAALDQPSHRLTQVELHYELAALYLDESNYQAAVAHYDAIHNLAETDNTKSEVTYLAGQALARAGDTAGAHTYYQRAVDNYPIAYNSYLALAELVEAEVPVDEFQRGLIDYHAGVYQPAINAFTRYMAANPNSYRPDTHLYLAWSYEGLGQIEAALAEIEAYAATARVEGSGTDLEVLATAQIRRAELLARIGRAEGAIDNYLQFVSTFPEHPEAPEMAYRAARLTTFEENWAAAATRFRSMAEAYPEAEQAPEALFRAGLSAWHAGDESAAVSAWEQLAATYPAHEYGAAALIWLMRTLPEDSAADYREQAASLAGSNYYVLRARDLAESRPPFTPPDSFDLILPPSAQAEAEMWLRDWLGLEASTDVAGLSPALAADQRLRLGETLWGIGLYNEAKRELEAVRENVREDALSSYQLALYFRDLGLYRSSILAAAQLLALSEDDLFDAPTFISHLLYPVHYADLILPLAEQYDYDPLLHFALVRQESLYESFAISWAAAKGLSQVIPSTGNYIADELNWPDYDDADLYRPAVGLAFGAFYLNQQLDGFNGNVYAALAAYNGGPGNAARWLTAAADNPDLFLETVNFPETRLYIQRIYVGHVIYRTLYGN